MQTKLKKKKTQNTKIREKKTRIRYLGSISPMKSLPKIGSYEEEEEETGKCVSKSDERI